MGLVGHISERFTLDLAPKDAAMAKSSFEHNLQNFENTCLVYELVEQDLHPGKILMCNRFMHFRTLRLLDQHII